MITIIRGAQFSNGESDRPAECRGKSTDTKPMDLPNGSTFYEMNTKKTYMFDEEGTQWLEV